jgi:Asp-tRNA(Asn)/Glu-tRNA(Gln) amidotransferase C subunit
VETQRIDKDKIKAQAKKIMDEFVAGLEKAEQMQEEFGVIRKDVMRVPGSDKYKGTEFRERVLKNAPLVEDDQIVAERKKW